MCRSLLENVAYEFVLTSSACLAHLTWMVCVMGGKWLYSCCFTGCCIQDLFKTACNILALLPSSFLFLSKHFVRPSGAAIQWYWHNYSLEEFLFYFIRDQISIWLLESIVIYAFPMCMLISLSVDVILLPRYMN